MAPPPRWTATVAAAQAEATLAVRLHNDPSERRALEGFIIHMHLAWLYVLQAKFTSTGVDIRYRRKDDARRFEKVDGEFKLWELQRCVREQWPTNSPVRANIEFFIGLRNRIEHRHRPADENMLVVVAGHTQAHLLNFENFLLDEFGEKYSMAKVLRFPLFIDTFTEAGEQTLLKLHRRLPSDLKRYMADYRSGLEQETLDDSRYEMRLRVILEHTHNDPDAIAMQFTRWDDMTQSEQASVEEMSRRGRTIIREKKRLIVGHGLLKPGEIVQKVSGSIDFKFNMRHHTLAWQKNEVRPSKPTATPEKTVEQFCVYDHLSNQYGYTEAWANRLIRKCSTASGFEEMIGVPPILKARK